MISCNYQHPFPNLNARHKNTSGGSIAVAAAEIMLNRDGKRIRRAAQQFGDRPGPGNIC
jgi:hypothetical protein